MPFQRLITFLVALFLLVCFADCGVTQSSVTAVEGGNVSLGCHSLINNEVEWAVNSRLSIERLCLECGQYRRIYSTMGFDLSFERQGRYYYRWDHDTNIHYLTITNLTLSDAGEYFCREDQGLASVEDTTGVLVTILGESR